MGTQWEVGFRRLTVVASILLPIAIISFGESHSIAYGIWSSLLIWVAYFSAHWVIRGFQPPKPEAEVMHEKRSLREKATGFLEACVPSNRRNLWLAICFGVFYVGIFLSDKSTLPIPLALISFLLPAKTGSFLFWALTLYFAAKHWRVSGGEIKDKKYLTGWLALFVYGMPLYILTYWGFTVQHANVAENWERLSHVPLYRFAFVWMLIGYAIRAIAPMFGLRLTYARSEKTSAFWQSYFSFLVIYSLCEILLFKLSIGSVIALNPTGEETVRNAVGKIVKENSSSILMSLIWLLYWRTSKSVRQTFGIPSGIFLPKDAVNSAT